MTNLLTQDVVPPVPSYRLIPLTQGQFAIVDEADFDWLNQWKWYAQRNDKTGTFYARRRDGNKRVWMHNAILKPHRGMKGDHLSGDTLDNRRQNLRAASDRKNAMNRRRRNDNTSGITGVQQRDNGKYRVRISLDNGRRISLGSYNTLEEATAVRVAAEKKYYKQFAASNRPLQIEFEKSEPSPRAKRKTWAKSGERCVYPHQKQPNKWVVLKWDGQKIRYIGTCDSIAAAAAARDSFETGNPSL